MLLLTVKSRIFFDFEEKPSELDFKWLKIRRRAFSMSLYYGRFLLLYYYALGPFFELFFDLDGPRGTRQKKNFKRWTQGKRNT